MERAELISAVVEATQSWEVGEELLIQARNKNGWFKPEQSKMAIENWKNAINESDLEKWLFRYDLNGSPETKVGVIMAGNIPLVGLHDALCVLLAGYSLHYKPSSEDEVLMVDLLNHYAKSIPEWTDRIVKVERIKGLDMVIATGSNNTSRYFEYYFKDIPHIIRKNRTSIAVLNGDEDDSTLNAIGNDIFSFFGKGCRNVSAVFVPNDETLMGLIKNLSDYSYVLDHHKWANNYTYHKAIWLMNSDPHFDTGFICLKESDKIHAPLGSIYFQKYTNLEEVKKYIADNEEEIQAIVGTIKDLCDTEPGKSQSPPIDWYADGIDTMEFLCAKNSVNV